MPQTMKYNDLLLSTDGPITTITLNRPDKRNALAMPMLLELTRAFQAVGNTDAQRPGVQLGP